MRVPRLKTFICAIIVSSVPAMYLTWLLYHTAITGLLSRSDALSSQTNNTTTASISATSSQEESAANNWYWLWSENTTYLWSHSAYMDTRVDVYGDPVVVAIVSRESRAELHNKSFTWTCHIRSRNNSSTCTGHAKLDPFLEGVYHQFHSFSTAAYFICPIPYTVTIEELQSVAFSPNACNSTSIQLSPYVPIMVHGTTVSKKPLGLCLHKALFGVKDQQALVEYIEIHKLLGVTLFTIYTQHISQGVRDILNTYSSEGLVDIIDWSIPISPKVIRDYAQVGVIHDCLLRNSGRVKYLGFSDFDEVFVPLKHSSLLDLLSHIDKPIYGSFRFLHVFMHKSPQTTSETRVNLKCSAVRYPNYFSHYIRSDYRDSNAFHGSTLGSKGKVIVKPEAIVRMGRHSMHMRTIHKFAPGFKELTVPGNEGLFFHYRRRVQKRLEKRPLVKDYTLSKYKNNLMEAINYRLCNTKN